MHRLEEEFDVVACRGLQRSFGRNVKAIVLNAANKEKRAEGTRQGALTVGAMMCGDLLEPLEGLVRFETLRNVLCALGTDAVVLDTASESQTDTSGGADSRERGVR